ncbi:hypothetical protein TNCV_2570061 [Trichonephila clavipes]|nr:hypothetical protein TNCV_2570061 [Trichonephila clavipes]
MQHEKCWQRHVVILNPSQVTRETPESPFFYITPLAPELESIRDHCPSVTEVANFNFKMNEPKQQCDEAGLFPLIAKSGADRSGEIPVISLIAGKKFHKWVVRNSDPFFTWLSRQSKETP